MESRWLSGHSLWSLHLTLTFAWFICTHGLDFGVDVVPFEGSDAMQLVNCTHPHDIRLNELRLLRGDTGEYILNVSYQGEECSTASSFTACVFREEVVSLLAVVDDMKEGEQRRYTCEAMYDGIGTSVHKFVEVKGLATAPPSQYNTTSMLRAGTFHGLNTVPIVECSKAREHLLSMILHDDDFSQMLGGVNVIGKSCTTSSSFASCEMDDAKPNVILRALVTGMAVGESRRVACEATDIANQKASVTTKYISVEVADTPEPDSGGGVNKAVDISLLLLTASCVTTFWWTMCVFQRLK